MRLLEAEEEEEAHVVMEVLLTLVEEVVALSPEASIMPLICLQP